MGGLVQAEPVTKTIELFNGKDLTNFYTWLVAPKKGEQPLGKNNDPLKVFTVQDGFLFQTPISWFSLIRCKP